MAATKQDTAIAALHGVVTESLKGMRETLAEIRMESNKHHEENVERRHTLRGRVDEQGNRIALMEATLRTIVGDNTGESGLLHDMKRGQEQLKDNLNDAREEFRRSIATVASDLREIKSSTASAPATRDFMNKWLGVGSAIGILGAVATVIGTCIAVLHYIARGH